MSDSTDDSWILYAETRDRFIALVRPLTGEWADRRVPLTPGWTIAQVLAHVCGLNADVAAGMREGLGTDERTANQVEVRTGLSIDRVCGEWLDHAEAMEAAIAENGFFGRRLAADLVVHLQDVQHAVGAAIDPDDEATNSGGRTYAANTPDRWLDGAGVAVAIDLADHGRFQPTSGPGPSTVTLRATPYDFLRSVTGRRSRAQVESLDWAGDPTPILDHFSPYGPLRDTDAAI